MSFEVGERILHRVHANVSEGTVMAVKPGCTWLNLDEQAEPYLCFCPNAHLTPVLQEPTWRAQDGDLALVKGRRTHVLYIHTPSDLAMVLREGAQAPEIVRVEHIEPFREPTAEERLAKIVEEYGRHATDDVPRWWKANPYLGLRRLLEDELLRSQA